MTKPLDCAYSMKVSLKRGAVCSASMTIDFMLSGMTTGNTPPKYHHAASKPLITSSVVCENVGQTKR
jgi:hypothetical protein